MANLPDIPYANLVSRAIDDFDSIFNVLVDKGLLDNIERPGADFYIGSGNKEEYRLGETGHTVSDGIPTSAYAELIRNQLSYIDGMVIDGYHLIETGSLQNGPSLTATYVGSNVTISGYITDNGVYQTSSRIDTTLATQSVVLQGNLQNISNPVGYSLEGQALLATSYTVKPTNNTILGSVAVAKGSIAKNSGTDGVTLNLNGITSQAAISIAKDGSFVDKNDLGNAFKIYAVSGHPEISNDHDVFHVFLKATPSISGNAIASTALAVIPGYINDFTNFNKTVNVAGAGTISDGNYVVDIAKGKVEAIGFNAETQISKASDLEFTDNAADGYQIKANVKAISADTTNANVVPGYIPDINAISFSNDSVTKTEDTKYIKKGSLGTAQSNAGSVTLQAGSITKDIEHNKYTIAVSANETYSKDIVDGYIAAADKTFEATITANKTIDIPKGQVSVASSATTIAKNNTPGNNNSILSESEIVNGYRFDLSANSTITPTTSTGYIEAADMNIALGSSGTKSFWVAPGNVSLSTFTFSATAVDTDAENLNVNPDGTVSQTSIFVDEAPNSGDYYKIDLNGIATTSAGYVNGSESSSQTITKYIQKATFKYVENSESDKYLEVLSGGFIDSGVIKNIAAITGNPDYATVEGIINGSILAVNPTNDDYHLTLSKGTIDAGYIASADGQGTLTGEAYITHGSATLSSSVNAITLSGTPVYDSNTGKYNFSGSTTVTSSVDLTEGYVKLDDINGTANGTTKSIEDTVNANLSLDKAIISVSSSDKVSIEATGGTAQLAAAGDSDYATVILNLDNSTVNVDVNTAGYLATTDSPEISVSADDYTVKIKAGSTPSISGSDNSSVQLTGQWDDSTPGEEKYIVSQSGYTVSMSGTLDEGYYANAKRNISGSVNIAARSFEITKANSSISVTGKQSAAVSAKIGANNVTLASSKTSGKTYLELTPSASITTTYNVETPGYVNSSGDVTGDVGSTAITGADKYIEVNTDNVNVTLGSAQDNVVTSQVISVNGTYNSSDITVNLDANSMGEDVADEISRLQARLQGVYTL